MKIKDLTIEYRKTTDLIPYARNARTHNDAQVQQLAASIKEFGFNNPIAIDADGMILCGHGRVMAAQKLGLEEVPTVCLSHLSQIQKKAYILADNKLALNAGWDDAMLSLELKDLEVGDIDLSITGFNDDELSELLKDVQGEYPELSTDDHPQVKTITFHFENEQDFEFVDNLINGNRPRDVKKEDMLIKMLRAAE